MIPREIKAKIEKVLPKPLVFLYKCARRPEDAASLVTFLFKGGLRASFFQRLFIIKKLYAIYGNVECPHTHDEILSFMEAILSIPPETEGCIVEAGSYKGGSTAKFSIAAGIAHRRLVAFDSFEGIPQHNEPRARTIFGDETSFPPGTYCGTLHEVKGNVARFGNIRVCEFVQGWFADTMPSFRPAEGGVTAIYLDVDLASSTRTCLKYLYPLLVPGGTLYSHDGHLPLVIDVFKDDRFWREEVGCPRPRVYGLGKRKFVRIVKPVRPTDDQAATGRVDS